MTWYTVMKTLRVSAQAVARTILRNFENVKPLSKDEAMRIQYALENSGVQDATTRLSAGIGRIFLKTVTK